MKILAVSDSHGRDDILLDLYTMYPKMDYYLHAGDSQSVSYNIFPFDSVLGNCDYYGDFPSFRRIKTSIGDIFIKHTPGINSKDKNGTKIFIYGHTHINELKEIEGIIYLNPGSVSRPRDGSLGSYAIIEIKDNEAEITIYELGTKSILKRMKLM